MHPPSILTVLSHLSLGALCYGAVLHHRAAPTSDEQCPATPIRSCQNTPSDVNTCCYPTPGGLIVHTQFWNTKVNRNTPGQVLPRNSWTMHGLWPDFCEDSWDSYCDHSRQYDPTPKPDGVRPNQEVPAWTGPGIDTFISDFGRDDLLEWMKLYWPSTVNPDAEFWAQEFSKHGTCLSTFDVKCYPNYREHEDVIDYFETGSKAFRKYPTYQWLEAKSIVPSNTESYKRSRIENALRDATGATPFLGCEKRSGKSYLKEVWYYTHSIGAPQSLDFVAVETKRNSNCGQDVFYPERVPGSEQ
ncbi:ribonuclease T2 [Serendipita vermifera]|nr:ribonuclease T2 [Serendipita vermifera]